MSKEFVKIRKYMEKTARDYMKQSRIEFLQVRLSGKHGAPDACDVYAGMDAWGLGAGVYPKAETPVPPFHEGCLCLLSPKIDLFKPSPKAQPSAEAAFLQTLDPLIAEQVRVHLNSDGVQVKKAKDC